MNHLQAETLTCGWNADRRKKHEVTVHTSDAALAEDLGVLVNDQNQFYDEVKGDEGGHDDHAPVGQTELPNTEEHRNRYDNNNNTGARKK